MINIICDKNTKNGPQKVIENLIYGLEKGGLSYTLNKTLKNENNIILNDPMALMGLGKYNTKTIVGPNLYNLPFNIPFSVSAKLKYAFKYLHPSESTVKLWKELGFNRCNLVSWPVGINTDEIENSSRNPNKVLIYHKKRDRSELNQIIEICKKMGLSTTIYIYGEYKQSDFFNELRSIDFIIWHGCPESQGIALLEALAHDVPMIVVEPLTFGAFKGDFKGIKLIKNKIAKTTDYFDETCGISINSLSMLNVTVENITSNRFKFTPRKYVIDNFNPVTKANDLISLFESNKSNEAYIELKDFNLNTIDKHVFNSTTILNKIYTRCLYLIS